MTATAATTAQAAAALDSLLKMAMETYDRAVSANRYAELAAAKLEALPLAEGECPCKCGRFSGGMAAQRTENVRSDLANLVRGMQEIRDALAA